MANIIGPTMPSDFNTRSDSDSDDDYGPSPPGHKSRHGSDSKKSSSKDQDGPGPPPSKSRQDTSDSSSDSSDSDGEQCPKSASSEFIGPVIPTGLDMKQDSSSSEEEEAAGEGSDDDMIGPMPSMSGSRSGPSAAEEFEKRAARMKKKLLEGDEEDKQPQREEWMTALPDAKLVTGMGLSSRTFRTDQFAREGRGDTSVWTDTPADRERKRKEAAEGGGDGSSKKQKREHVFLSEREKMMAEQVAEHNKDKRAESLLEMHQKKLHKKDKKKKKEKDKKKKKKKEKEKEKEKSKKKKEKKEKKPERRPFDRDLDLKVNQFDDVMRKSYIKKAQGLGGNFGHSSQGKFL